MAFEYAGVKQALKRWAIASLPQWFNDHRVWTYSPRLQELSEFPALIVRAARSVPTVPGAIQVDYTLDVGLVTRNASSKAASEQLDALLKDFDTAWADESNVLDSSLGNWARRTQEGLPTEFDPAIEDAFGLIVYVASKQIRITERVAGRTF